MSTAITHAGGVITASMEEWRVLSEARSIVHTILGRVDPDITLRPTSLRRGSFVLAFETGEAAQAARLAMTVPQVLTLSNSGVAEVSMQFVIAGGELEDALDRSGFWTLEVPFQEVSV